LYILHRREYILDIFKLFKHKKQGDICMMEMQNG
jgi:hypothetical protein